MDNLVSLLSDGRVRFLLWAVLFAIVVAVLLGIFEFYLKSKSKKKLVRKERESVFDGMLDFLKGDWSPREKLDFIDGIAKRYFKEIYGLQPSSGYSFLIKDFERKGKREEVLFCRSIFDAYYSSNGLTDEKVKKVGELLFNLGKKGGVETEETESFWEALKDVFYSIRFFSVKSSDDESEVRSVPVDKVENKKRMIQEKIDRHRMVRDDLVLKKEKKRDFKVRKKVARINERNYMKEMRKRYKFSRKEDRERRGFLGSGFSRPWWVFSNRDDEDIETEGVAERIVREEKSRLSKGGEFYSW